MMKATILCMKYLADAGRVLAFCSASLLAALSARAGFDTSDVVFHYAMDEVGRAPVVHDSSGNGHHAFITNDWPAARVSGGLMSNEKCFYGFENNKCQVVATNVVENWSRNWSFVCWVRNPDMTSEQNHIIARGACSNSADSDTYDGCWYDNAWQVWITPGGAMAVQIQNWGGDPNHDSVTGEVLTWESDVWYQIAVVETFYVHDRDTRYRKISVYVTKAGSESIGEPAVEMEWDTPPGYGTGGGKGPYNLIIGAARTGSYAMPNGCLKGDMRDAWLFTRTLDVSELLADVQAFSPSWHATDDYATLHWNLNETGETPVAVDATGNGYDGVSTNGVRGGFPAPVGTCYGGFKQDVDSLFVDLGSARYFSDSNRSEVVLWVKKPSPTAANTALLAGNVKQLDSTSIGKDQCWRVFVEESGAVGILMNDWNGHIDRAVGRPYDWGKGWNLVSIKFDHPSRDHLIGSVNADTGVTNYTSGTCSRIRVYAAPAAKAGSEGDFTLVAECEGSWKGQVTYGQWLVFGHSGPAWQNAFKPASILGEKGRIGEIAFKTGGWFEFDYLRSRLSRYYEPPRGFRIILQ